MNDSETNAGGWPKAVLWDMDGTLIDSEPIWGAGERYVIEKHGGVWRDDLPLEVRGMSTPRLLDFLQRHIPGGKNVDRETLRAEIFGYVMGKERDDPRWTKGSIALLGALAAAGIPSILVSASPRCMVDSIIAQTPRGAFAGYICGEDGYRAKPDPEPYVQAARMAGADPADCLVFEDSAVGLRSARAAGCVVCAITGYLPEGTPDDVPRDWSQTDYTGLTVEGLSRTVARIVAERGAAQAEAGASGDAGGTPDAA